MKTLPKPELPTTTQMTQAAHRMMTYGGSFDHYLGQAYFHADSHNRETMTRAFASRFTAFIPHD